MAWCLGLSSGGRIQLNLSQLVNWDRHCVGPLPSWLHVLICTAKLEGLAVRSSVCENIAELTRAQQHQLWSRNVRCQIGVGTRLIALLSTTVWSSP